MNKEELEKNWTDRGFSFGFGTIKDGDGVNEAVHDDMDELVFMEIGKYEFTVGNDSFIQEGGEEVLIPAGATHSIKNLSEKDSIIYYGYKQKDL
ncbi:MAG: cupin domain-containing protein [Thiotrichaceae bacterium]|nr:cupin domain-containing protein [Thiotrichaceae bacterium]